MSVVVSNLFFELAMVATRLTPLFLAVGNGPLQRIPGTIRLVLLIVFTIIITSIVEFQTVLPNSFSGLVIALLFEFLVGICFAFYCFALFSAFLFWGKVLDMQIGFGAAGILDPNTKVQNSLIGSILLVGALTLFYIFDLHHFLLIGLVSSFEFIPTGIAQLTFPVKQALGFFSLSFIYTLTIFFPVIVIMWCFDLFMGYMSRTMPQMNIYFVFLPLKIMVGLFSLSQILMLSSGSFSALYEMFNDKWLKVVGG